MYPHQAERLTEALERTGLEALVATSPANIVYVTGFRSVTDLAFRAAPLGVFSRQGAALVVPADEVAAIVADAIDVDTIVSVGEFPEPLGESPNAEARRIRSIVGGGAASAADALATALERLGVRQGSIGVDQSSITHETWQRLTDRLRDVKLVPAAAALAAARRAKAPYEIECLGHALRIAEEALDVVIQSMDRGMTERDAATAYSTEAIKRGAWPHPPVIATGERAAIPSPPPTDRAVRPGDLIRFHVGCVYKGYHASVDRTAVLGEPTPAQEVVYRAIQAGLEAAVATFGPDTRVQRIVDAAREAVRANGLPHYDALRVGHGIGLDPCEEPNLVAGSETTVEMGEVLSIGACHRELGVLGAAVKDTVLVTSTSARVLNHSHRGLVVLD
ncbi:MAG TPA: Xaa-Pro peptidase family protein [Methylomirabilota bacterium]|jgi:Xaa-Pro aminopeptidase|nr:Xaa-Pro peptidase family protein [Methylomirabilota bacterium]